MGRRKEKPGFGPTNHQPFQHFFGTWRLNLSVPGPVAHPGLQQRTPAGLERRLSRDRLQIGGTGGGLDGGSGGVAGWCGG